MTIASPSLEPSGYPQGPTFNVRCKVAAPASGHGYAFASHVGEYESTQLRNALKVDRSHRSRGQSVAEFAVILPVMLTLFGAAIDFSRLYNAWINLEAATRDAAEYAATKTTTQNSALTESRRIICGAFGLVSTCTDPAVTVTFSSSTTAAGASTKNPIATVSVAVSTTFRALFPYPFTNNGVLTLGSTRTYAITQGK